MLAVVNDPRAPNVGLGKTGPEYPERRHIRLVAIGLAVELLEKSRVHMATAVLTAFECYLRSGNIKNAKCKHHIYLDPPIRSPVRHYGILSLPKTKRGANESLYIRD